MQPLTELWSYTISPFLLNGAVLAVKITALGMGFGVLLGLGLALAATSRLRLVSAGAKGYIWFVRGTPLLLQLVFIFDALPLIGWKFDSFTTAVITFALNEAAFSSEIIRGGIISVASSQWSAAASLGMGGWLTLRRIILPQALRTILPGIINDTISMLKLTSIASVIFVDELTFRAQQIVGQNFKFFTVFGAAAVIYLALTSVISLSARWLDRRLDPEREIVPSRRGRLPAESPVKSPAAPASAGTIAASADEPERLGGYSELAPADAAREEDPQFVALRDVHKAYSGREILKGIDFDIARGEVVAILGPSGSGKSTLLRLINHLEAVDRGEIRVAGELVGYERQKDGTARPVRNLARARAKARIGFVFQHFNLFAHLSALENVMEAPVRVHGEAPARARERARALLRRVGLETHEHHRPNRLSGGQQQRVAIARALATSPRLMLFDEPTSALDPELVGEVLQVIRDLANGGMTMIVVTHEIRFARDVADRVVFMDGGKIVECGTPAQIIDNPQNERTRRFLRAIVENEEATV